MLILNLVHLFYKVTVFAHYLWVAILAVAVVAYLCWREIGLSVLPGVFLFVLLVPLQGWMGRFFVRLRYCNLAFYFVLW